MRSVLDGIGRLQIGVAGQRRIDPRRAGAVGLVAGDAGAGVDRLACGHLRRRRRGHRGLRRAGRQVLQVDRDGADIGVAHLRGRIDHDFRHQPAGVAPAVAAALQIFGDVVDAPGFQPAALGAVEPRREPAIDQSAAIGPAAFVGAQNVLRRMAGAAMRRARRPDNRRDSIPRSSAGSAGRCRAGRTENSSRASARGSSAASAVPAAAGGCEPAAASRDRRGSPARRRGSALVKFG